MPSVEEAEATIADNPVVNAASKKQIRKEEPQEPTDTVNVAKMSFDESIFEFGTVDEGERVEHVFKFENTGKVPLVISNAKGSCGCTVPEWPKEPIAVGDSGEIKVSFNTSGKRNQQTKTVTLTSNTYPTKTILTVKGNVTPKVQPQQTPGKNTTANKGHDHSHDGHDHSHHGHDHNHNH